MNIFFDTSSLIKLYHKETGTEIIKGILYGNNVNIIYLSEISKIEFALAIWKKIRAKQMTEEQGRTTIHLFYQDYNKYSFIQIDDIITESAYILINKYGMKGLRTLDSIQLATAVSLKSHASLFITSDILLKELFVLESLRIE